MLAAAGQNCHFILLAAAGSLVVAALRCMKVKYGTPLPLLVMCSGTYVSAQAYPLP